jgi:periplasmic divalent cation tolerance protein
MISVITTLHKKEDAIRIGKRLLEKRLVACYNLWPIESAYWWKEEILEEPETMMLLKTIQGHFEEVAAYIKEESGYEVPDIFTLQPGQVVPVFEQWVHDETSQNT